MRREGRKVTWIYNSMAASESPSHTLAHERCSPSRNIDIWRFHWKSTLRFSTCTHTHTVSASFLPYICGRIVDPYCRSLFYTGLHFLLVVELCLNDSTFVAFCWRFEEHRPCGGLRVPCSSSAEFSRFGAARVEANVHCPWHVHDIVTIVLHFGEPHL